MELPESDLDWVEWPGLTERQKKSLRHLLPRPKPRPFLRRQRKGGRPRADDMACFEAVLWKVWTDRSWAWLPEKLGRRRTVLARMARWDSEYRLIKLYHEFARGMTRAEASQWKTRLARAMAKNKPLWKMDFLIALQTHWPGPKTREKDAEGPITDEPLLS